MSRFSTRQRSTEPVKIFRRDGFVLVRDALDADQTAFLRKGVVEVVDDIVALDEQRGGNRGSQSVLVRRLQRHSQHVAPGPSGRC